MSLLLSSPKNTVVIVNATAAVTNDQVYWKKVQEWFVHYVDDKSNKKNMYAAGLSIVRVGNVNQLVTPRKFGKFMNCIRHSSGQWKSQSLLDLLSDQTKLPHPIHHVIILTTVQDTSLGEDEITMQKDTNSNTSIYPFKQVDIHVIQHKGREGNICPGLNFLRMGQSCRVYSSSKYTVSPTMSTFHSTKSVEPLYQFIHTPILWEQYEKDPEAFIDQAEYVYLQIITQRYPKSQTDRLETLESKVLNWITHRTKTTTAPTTTEALTQVIESKSISVQDKIRQMRRFIIKNDPATIAHDVHMIVGELTKADAVLSLSSLSDLNPLLVRRKEYTGHSVVTEMPPPLGVYRSSPELLSVEKSEEPYYCFPLSVHLPSEGIVPSRQRCTFYNNPLRILEDPLLQYEACKMIEMPILLEERAESSRKNFLKDTLVISMDPFHMKCTYAAIASLFLGAGAEECELVGVPQLWLIVVYTLLRKQLGSDSQFDAPLKQFKRLIKQECTRSEYYLTLSGRAIFPQLKAPLHVCLWYSVMSPLILHFDMFDDSRNRLRWLGPCATEIIHILVEVFDLEISAPWLHERIALYSALQWMVDQQRLHLVASNDSSVASSSSWEPYWYDVLLAQTQNACEIDGVIVFLDGPAPNPPTVVCPFRDKLTLSQLHHLASKVTLTRHVHMITLPKQAITDFKIPAPISYYRYSTQNYGADEKQQHQQQKIPSIPICPATMRPYTYDLTTGKHWQIACRERNGSLKYGLSIKEYFIRFVTQHMYYPTNVNEFMVYMCLEQRKKGIFTLPVDVKELIHAVLEDYGKVTTLHETPTKPFSMSPFDFISVAMQSRGKILRGILDGTSPVAD